jgi:hypothetical protein
MNKEIRWKQRFVNFEKAFQTLERTVAIENPSEAERGGLIQFFVIPTTRRPPSRLSG